MIILDNVNRKLRVVLSGAKALNDCPVTVHYVDAPLYIPDSIPIFTNGVTAIDIIAGLAAPNTRHIKLITFVNADTAPVVAQFIYNDNTTLYPITGKITLQVSDTLAYTDGEGWAVLDSNGNRKGVGNIGPAGPTGPQGLIGAGIPAIDGKAGPMGMPGVGIQGPIGNQGIQGPQGNPGAGLILLDGKKGDFGLPGVQGIQGIQGIQGLQGNQGKDGLIIFPIDGKQGPMGFPIPGAQGIQGIQGIPGTGGGSGGGGLVLDGKIGPMGFPGPPGPVDGTKISGLTLATSILDADEFPANEAGTTKKKTGTLFKAYVGDTIKNASVTDQAIGASVTNYLVGSALPVPVGKLRIGTWFRWKVWVGKSASGTIALIFLVKIGTLGTTSDTTLFTFTHGVGTAVADTGWYDVYVICRGPLSASGLFQLEMQFDHNLATTGLNNVQRQIQETLSGTFDVTTAGLILGLAITTPASYALTLKAVVGEAMSL